MARIHRTWEDSDFFEICRAADDGYRASKGREPDGNMLLHVGAIMTLVERYATPRDCAMLADQLHCTDDSEAIARHLARLADERMERPSVVLVDILQLTVT